MAQLQIVYLPQPGTQERWRRPCQEVAGSRKDRFAAFCQQAGITQVLVRLVDAREYLVDFMVAGMMGSLPETKPEKEG
jgi:hypothetical protein